ncbi:uncharacterized protein LOC118646364 [Monomorium pharaonis]|uniref:uncharacterized protein LOC118646364 n=1 Tax=Monomorium pharaonis TaxID=307658 RepID=UPI001746AB33|nr:uncharacterized protein LOC118646364 [Monomorium pharaonis]
MSESQKPNKAERPVTPRLDVPEERSSSRNVSPVRLSAELTLKVQTQLGRLAAIKSIAEMLPQSHEETSLEELNQFWLQIEETHKAFNKEHAYFEVSWPAALTNYEYFSRNAHQQEILHYMAARRLIGKLRHSLTVQPAPAEAISASSKERRVNSRLPDLSLPKFSGDYAAWPAFRDLFVSIILFNQQLTDVEKLHYLRTSLEGAAARAVSGLPMTDDSLGPSWDILKDKFENKRLLIQACLDKLFASSTPVPRKSAAQDKLLTEVKEALSTLEALGVKDDLGDCAVVYHVTRLLDRVTREKWENAVCATREYPKFEKLEEFLASNTETLQRVEAVASQPGPSSSTVTSKKTTAHQTSQRSDSSTASVNSYPCDCCNGQHFVVMCTKFRELSVQNRHKVAVDKRLCFNCLGRHSVRSCKSLRGCKKCTERHHTMLHDARPTASSAPSNNGSLATPST